MLLVKVSGVAGSESRGCEIFVILIYILYIYIYKCIYIYIYTRNIYVYDVYKYYICIYKVPGLSPAASYVQR